MKREEMKKGERNSREGESEGKEKREKRLGEHKSRKDQVNNLVKYCGKNSNKDRGTRKMEKGKRETAPDS